MGENTAQREFLAENTQKPDLLLIQNDLRKSFDVQKTEEMQHAKDFSPSSDLLFGTSSASYVKPTLETRNYNIGEAYAPLSTGEYVAKFDTYKEGRDNNEYFASQQTTGEKWANGATKFLAKTGSAVLGGTAGLVYGVGSALNDGSFSSIYDNSFSNTLADWDTKLQYQLPNLYTKQEQEKGLFGQMGTANFWSDKFLGGLSFTAGAIISEGIWAYATGGMSLATSGARLGTRVGRWGVEALGEANAIAGLTKYKSFYKTMLQGEIAAGKISKALPNALGKAGELASSVGVLARSAGYEASVEALQYKREATENFHQNFAALNGREPSQEEILEFKNDLENSANTVFATNMAILMPSNLVTMGHILDIKSPIKTGFGDFIERKAFGYGMGKTVDDLGKATYKALEATTGQKIARTAFNYVIKPAVTEGLFEEGLQGVTTKTANKWIEHSYDPKYSNATLDTMGAFYESLGEQYGTKEGWVENGLGMLIGIAGGSINARSEMAQKKNELDYQSAVATTYQTSNLQGLLMPNKIQSANRMAGFSEEARVEAQKGNVSKSSLAQKSALLTFINAKMVLGEDISDIVNEVKLGLDSTTVDQWKAAGITEDKIDDHKEESLKDFEDLAKDWKANKTYWGYMIGSKLVGGQTLDTKIAGETFGKGDTGAIIEALAWQSTIGETANKHMKDAQQAIAQELGIEHASAINLNSNLRAQSRELKQQINVATRSYKVELARRDALVARIAKLNAAPKQPEAANKPAGKQAAVLTQSLLEAESKLAALDTELQGYAEDINKTSAYQKELGAIDFSSQDLSQNIISGQDLVSLKDNLDKFQTTLDRLQTTNPQRSSYLNELLKEYSDSEQVFLENQATQRAIAHPDFKIEQINSWIQGKVKKNAPMNENTSEWLSRTLETYKKTKTDAIEERDEAIRSEEKSKRKQEIISALDAIEDPESEEAKQLQAELDNLEKPEEVTIPRDNKEAVVKSEEEKIKDEIAALEVKRQEELSGVQPDLTITSLNDLDSLSEEERVKLKEQARQKIDALPDDVFFLTHLTQTTDNLNSILTNGLNAPVLEGTTNVSIDKEGLYSSIEALIDGKVRHANASNLIIIAFPKNIIPEGTKKNQYTDFVENYIAENHPEEFGKVPAQYNIATFSNGQVTLVGETAVSQSEQTKEAINEKYDKKIEALQNELTGKAPSQAEVYKKRISDALKKGHNYLSYMGDNYDDVANKKPTSAEVEEFKKLREEKKFDETRYKELQQKLSDWKLLDSAVDEEYVSIGDLILGVEQLEQEVEEQETLDEVTPEHAADIADNEGIQASENVTRQDILQNTNGSMSVKKKKGGNLSLHHLKLATIASEMKSNDFTLVNKEGNNILFGEEEPGSVLTVEGVEFEVIEGNAIKVNEEEFMKLQERLNMYPLNTGTVSWSYSDIYTKVGDIFVKRDSDFKDDTINSERIYELEEGDKLTITINEDGYNDKLFAEYEAAKKGEAKDKALDKLKRNLKLNATTTTGTIENVSVLKALREAVDEQFIRIRDKAFEQYISAPDKSNVNVGVSVLVDGIFLGSPRFTIVDGSIRNNPITERGAKEVIATGYIQNGEIVTNREIKDVNKTYVGKLSKSNASKKIPIVVFKRGAYNIAYPVTMNKTSSPLTDLFDSIVSMRISDQELVRKINQEIQDNKIDTDKLSYEDVYNEQKMQDTRKAFEDVETFVTAEEFADKNYKVGNIVSDASINIDLEDIDNIIADAKLRIKLDDSVKFMTERELKYESMIGLENELNDIAESLYKDYVRNAQTKYVKSNGDIIEDTGYTDTFDDNSVETPTSQLDKIKNINTLRKAFEGLTAPLKKIIGQDVINKVNEALKQYDFIKSQITPNKNTVNNGKGNASCP